MTNATLVIEFLEDGSLTISMSESVSPYAMMGVGRQLIAEGVYQWQIQRGIIEKSKPTKKREAADRARKG